MILIPAVDIYEGKAVRLLRGDYKKMTVYSDNPLAKAKEIESVGASHIHLVDLEGAKTGKTPNLDIVSSIAKETDLSVEVGGGIRSLDIIEKYLTAGIDKVILGTVAVENEALLAEALSLYGEKIAVGVDARDGKVAVRGWFEESSLETVSFVTHLRDLGVKSVIVTDISKDGAMGGSNHALYRELLEIDGIALTASGGVSSYDDIAALREIGVHSAILGKAMYEGAVELDRALEVAGGAYVS